METNLRAQKTCLVLGGRGFIGSHLVAALAAEGWRVRSFDRAGSKPLVRYGLCPSLEQLDGDFTDAADVARAVEGCEVCFHLVSTTLPKTSNDDPLFDVESNLLSSIRFLQQAHKAGVKRVVFVSSGGTVYGPPRELPIPETHATDPQCSYGIVKLAIEKYLELFRELHGLDYRILRLSNPFGEGQRLQASQGAVAVFLGKALRGERIEIWGDGTVVRDYVHISDVVAALTRAATAPTKSRVFNIGSGEGLSLNGLLDGIEHVLGRPARRVYLNARAFDVPVNLLDIGRARQELGWAPRLSFIEGLMRFAAALDDSAVGGAAGVGR
ncbi:NAD-dependent epimerase/dehydratase family protein [Aquabacter sp. L1I39]|uniref:NAD-dependent epimerase/dehydratase family protein n=1 Tax=Aquabacter sp. L1I39 TaxID=2820278 RepID=UPI001ADAA163|nr:NAD-dependent epimerase/dehydratase family protein [Aquabacter sp. L1I39]QTL03036.1 NAD-dependent epimerase/dehydratase family protein [Aquabacter sp. L1I39]